MLFFLSPCDLLCLSMSWLGQKELPRYEPGLAQPRMCPQATVPHVLCKHSNWVRTGVSSHTQQMGTATTQTAKCCILPCLPPLGAAQPGCPGPLGRAVLQPPSATGHRGTDVAICWLSCTGAARAWLNPLGSRPSPVCTDPAPTAGCRCTIHPLTQPLAFSYHLPIPRCLRGQDGWLFPLRLCCSPPFLPALPLREGDPLVLPAGSEVLASGTAHSGRAHKAFTKGAPSH